MKLFFYLLLAFIVLLFGISFALKNPQSVEVIYYYGVAWSGSLSALLVITLIVGAFLGVLFTLGWVIRAKRQASQARREASHLEQEAASLRPLLERELQ